jgi:hypothetical protein
MSRLAVSSYQPIKTFQYFTPSYKEIIREKDKSIYDENDGSKWDNFEYVINKYTGNDYWVLNDYLRDGVVTDNNYTAKDLKSWAWCLHSSLEYFTSNVSNGEEVYRGISIEAPRDWRVGSRFYFAEFVSTSVDYSVAEQFAKGVTMLVIKIKNNGNNGNNNYCRDISEISQYPEEEILLTAFCRYEITDIRKGGYYDPDIFYLDCIGY